MKTKNTFLTLLFAAVVATLASCGGSKSEHHHDEAAGQADTAATAKQAPQANAPQFAVDASFQKQLANLFDAYVKLKDAFVSTDAAKVKTEASTTQQALAAVDMKLVSGAAHNDWMAYLGEMETSLKDIQASGDIAAQRKTFSNLSNSLYKTIKAYGLGGETAYYEYCPMAFNNEGAFWLSDQEAIRNPYFGDEMLTCGSVKETLK